MRKSVAICARRRNTNCRFIDDDGVRVADSTFIRLHLERKYGVDFDKNLSTIEKGFAWSVEKMLEDHLYWATVYWRWMVDSNFNKGPEISSSLFRHSFAR